jgi:RimJ/RimL family protein N-acetyltransferase
MDHEQLPIGEALPDWQPPPQPPHAVLKGRFCRLEPLRATLHAEGLFEATREDEAGLNYTYLSTEPFADFKAYCAWVKSVEYSTDPMFYAIVRLADNHAVGMASYLRITPVAGSIEVGHIHYTEQLKRTPAATEAMYLLMQQAFALGYRRYEWKCDALNASSRAAADRLGFSFEGIFRQATVYKHRSRDTAWYSVLDKEWPALKQGFEQWLSPENFDEQGLQRFDLRSLRA